MGRNKVLTSGECHTVEILKKQGMSAAKMARVLEQSATRVKNCIKRINLTQNCANPMMRRMPKRLLATKISSNNISPRTLIRSLKKNDWRRVLWTDKSSISTIHMEKFEFGIIMMSFIIQSAHKQPLKWSKLYYGLGMYVIYPMVMVAEEAIFQEDNALIHKRKSNRKPQTEADLEEAVFAAWNT
ncbi:3999_t:CDS:2 [Ambispora gerdemannii]|uniref:3999_t:CDS:1 n=1 Tax=Ambispora gerdemannii TaxID=144530 RepID=A0A9N9B3D4_9GLOM|nr:3999_t:CDS:2 [Ambispora gerdemannii]